MKYDEFIKHVQSFAQLDSRETAQTVAKGVLETIAERIVGNESHQLAAQLPAPLSDYLEGHEGQNGNPFSLHEFYQRLSEKLDIDPIEAADYARAVFAVLNSAVTPGEFADFKANFSKDYQELFAVPGKV